MRISVFFILCVLAACTYKKPQDNVQSEVIDVQQNELPSLRLTFADGQKISARDLTGKTVLVLLQPDCDHCQREAQQISEHSKSFDGYKVYFISSAPVTEILEFAGKYGLKGHDNFLFAETPFNDVVESFGPIETPSLYVYSAERKLVEAFNGEVAMEVIVKYLWMLFNTVGGE